LIPKIFHVYQYIKYIYKFLSKDNLGKLSDF